MIKLIIKSVIGVLVAGGILFALWKFGLLGGKNELKIDETANVVEEIRKIGEFTSACYYEEMVIRGNKRSDFNDSELGRLKARMTNREEMDEIVLIANGKVRAGFDLSAIDADHISVSGDTLSMELPEAKIFDVIVNPSDYEVYVETGRWEHSQVTSLQKEARDSLERNALSYGLVKKAEKAGLEKLDNMFRTFGFNTVCLTVQK